MTRRVWLTCDSCGEEYDVSPTVAAVAKAEGYYVCSDCDGLHRIEAFDYTDDRGAFAWFVPVDEPDVLVAEAN